MLQEGNAVDIFMNTSVNERGSEKPAEFEGAPVLENLHHHTGSREDIINLRNQGFQVDDDNDPVEENIHGAGSVDVQVEDKHTYKDCGCNGIDPRKVDGCDTNREAKIKSMGSQELTFTG